MQLVNTSTSIAAPVSLEEARDQLSQLQNQDDLLINRLLVVGYQHAQNYCDAVIPLQTFSLLLDCFESEIVIPVNPVVAITEIRYIDAAGVEQVLADYHVQISRLKTSLRPPYGEDWPEIEEGYDKVTIYFTAGYQRVPEALKQGILMIASELFANREESIIGATASPVPLASKQLLAPYRSLAI